jgi:membrane-associated phospholipid phosphatase
VKEMKRSTTVFIICAFIFGFIGPTDSIGAEQSSLDYRLSKEVFKRFGSDVYQVIRSPAEWKSQDFWRLAAVLGAGTLLFAFDEDIDDWSQEHRTSSSEDLARFGSALGDGGYLGAMIATAYLAGEVFGNRSLRKTALLSLESWLTSGAFVLGIKAITGRARPHTGKGPRSFQPFAFRSGYYSFPSGHAASAFAVAAVVADQSDCFAIDILAFSLSALVTVSRVHENKHWASDAFIGAAIGYVVGKKISGLHRGQDQKNLQVGFCFSPRMKGLTVSLRF